ncbi:MAG TPA: xylulokinase [Planctomycetota bacterium]
MALYLGLDVGTQGTKSVLYDASEGRVVSRGAKKYGMLPVKRAGAAEQDPRAWIDAAESALVQALTQVGVDRRSIRGLGVSGQQHGFVPLDAKNQVIRPAKLWCDTETAAEAEELSATLGRPIPAGFTASKILWLARHEPENFARLRRVLLPHDYVNLHFTGVAAMEPGDASGTGFFDPVAREWDAAACAAIDPRLREMLPEVGTGEQAIGAILPALARRFRLTDDLFVAPGSGDNMMSALGAGAVEPGVLCISLGTSGTIFGHAPQAVVDEQGLVASFCDATGGGLPLLCTMNCTTVGEEVRVGFGGVGHETITREASEVAPGCDGLMFLPYLVGERAPNWPHARGVLMGMQPGNLRRGHLYRAALEGATLALREGYARMEELGLAASELRLVGGGARNGLWRRIVADVFELPLRLPSETETAALGAALQAAAVDAGQPVGAYVRGRGVPLEDEIIEPDSLWIGTYQLARQRFHEAGQLLFGGS